MHLRSLIRAIVRRCGASQGGLERGTLPKQFRTFTQSSSREIEITSADDPPRAASGESDDSDMKFLADPKKHPLCRLHFTRGQMRAEITRARR
jgi:hypothetical protein